MSRGFSGGGGFRGGSNGGFRGGFNGGFRGGFRGGYGWGGWGLDPALALISTSIASIASGAVWDGAYANSPYYGYGYAWPTYSYGFPAYGVPIW